MKVIILKLLALCVLSLSNANAFVFPTPKTSTLKGHTSIASSAGEGDPWDMGPNPPTHVQGGALRTWKFPDTSLERVYVALESGGPPEGNPLKTTIELKTGQDNTPHFMDIYTGKGKLRPFKTWIEMPGMDTNTLFIRNTNPVEYPFDARVSTEMKDSLKFNMGPPLIIQGGGTVKTWDVPPAIDYMKVILTTNGRPLDAMVELVQGPNAPKYTLQVYTENGTDRPFATVMKTPGAGNTVRIINTGPDALPLNAIVGPNI